MRSTPSIKTGSDHGPAGSSAVTTIFKNEGCRRSTMVVVSQNRPFRHRKIGANTPEEGGKPSRGSCPGRCSACPIRRQCTRSRLCQIGQPGYHSKVDVARNISSPTRHHDGSGANPGMTGFRASFRLGKGFGCGLGLCCITSSYVSAATALSSFNRAAISWVNNALSAWQRISQIFHRSRSIKGYWVNRAGEYRSILLGTRPNAGFSSDDEAKNAGGIQTDPACFIRPSSDEGHTILFCAKVFFSCKSKSLEKNSFVRAESMDNLRR